MSAHRETAALKSRWTAQALSDADRAFAKMDPVAAYQGKQPPYPFVSPFGTHEDYADFRCLPLGAIPANRTIERADLTGATDARGGQLCCALIECRVDRASMETNLGEKRIHRCSFVRTKFTHSTLRGEFVDCDFSCCDLSYSGGSQLKFVRCNFANAKFVGARFQHSYFENCTWDGAKIANAAFGHGRFIGGRPSAEQLADAMVPGAVFEPSHPIGQGS
ncbi:MAG: pentapeptide repeat-containing protein [Xanthomonadales bacterium]|nr:pentapeptide repeat-containing protein [Xanthomonadales bacterium]MBP9156117.1 pentapeptide repeat-containing protein [Xanthomonadales bacterium]